MPRKLRVLPGRTAGFGRRLAGAMVVVAVSGVVAAAAVVDAPSSTAADAFAEDEPVVAPAMVPAATDEGAASESDAGTAADAALLSLRTVEVSITRDPFEPVRPEREVAGGDAGDPADPSRPTDPSDPSGPSAPSTNGEQTAPPSGNGTSSGRCVDQGELVCDGQVVAVVATTSTGATITVGGTRHEVAVGGSFADGYTLLSVDAEGCAVLSFGGQTVRGCPGSGATLK